MAATVASCPIVIRFIGLELASIAQSFSKRARFRRRIAGRIVSFRREPAAARAAFDCSWTWGRSAMGASEHSPIAPINGGKALIPGLPALDPERGGSTPLQSFRSPAAAVPVGWIEDLSDLVGNG
jgi:hypothetical protein